MSERQLARPVRAVADSEDFGLFGATQIDLAFPAVERPCEPAPERQPPARRPKTVSGETRAKADADCRKGHRQRLRTRFTQGGADAMPDYELLELVLCRAVIRMDVKPLAKRLLAYFGGSFAAVVHAAPDRLREVDGVGERVVEELKIVRAAALRMMQSDLRRREALTSWQAVIDYLKAAQGFDDKETFRILFLDKRNQLIADEVQGRGTVDHTPVYVREVVARTLELAATAIILVHNHPSGDPQPSRADIEMTKLIASAARPLGIIVQDHIIVGRNGHCSMKAERLF
jgi:DNA repair protein RadC